jgi:hypothetical protein
MWCLFTKVKILRKELVSECIFGTFQFNLFNTNTRAAAQLHTKQQKDTNEVRQLSLLSQHHSLVLFFINNVPTQQLKVQ